MSKYLSRVMLVCIYVCKSQTVKILTEAFLKTVEVLILKDVFSSSRIGIKFCLQPGCFS